MEMEVHLQQLSFHQEPIWSLEQMLLESMYAVEGLVEVLFESEAEKEGVMLKHVRSLSTATHTHSKVCLNMSNSALIHEPFLSRS